MNARAELEARLAKARAEKTSFDRQLADREELAELEREVAEIERENRDAPAILAAIDEHGPVGTKIAIVRTDLGAIVLKRPNPIAYRKFQDGGSMAHKDVFQLARSCLVYPSADAFESIANELPATTMRCADAVCDLARGRTKELSGKS